MPQEEVIVVEERGPGCLGQGMAWLGVVASVFWLLNFTAGIVELPDALPLVGNLDEAAAAGLLFSCLRYLGFDVLPFKKRRQSEGVEVIEVKAGETKNE